MQARPRLTKLPEEAQVAQLVEQRTENPRVGGSNPPLGTIVFIFKPTLWMPRDDLTTARITVVGNILGNNRPLFVTTNLDPT